MYDDKLLARVFPVLTVLCCVCLADAEVRRFGGGG